MRETAIMDFLTNLREDGSGVQASWAPTAEKVLGPAGWRDADAPVEEDRRGQEPSFLSVHASQFEPPVTPFGADPALNPGARPPGFGPPVKAWGAATSAGPPALSPEDLQALEELASAESVPARGAEPARSAASPAAGRAVDTWPPGSVVTASSTGAALSSPGAPGAESRAWPNAGGASPVAGTGGVGVTRQAGPASQAPVGHAPVGSVGQAPVGQASVATDRAKIVQPIPTWPPPGVAASWPAPGSPAKNIGPVPSRHRPDARRTARRRAALALLIVVLVAVLTWLVVVKHERPGRLTRLAAPAAVMTVPGPVYALPSGPGG